VSSARLHVSFVCSFNRARSVMAATLFAEQMRERGLGDLVRVSSAGTLASVGDSADEQACFVLAERGYPVPADHRAAMLGAEHLGADLVVALGREHVGVLREVGVDDDRLRCVDVRNPMFGADFEHAFDAIDAAMPGLHAWLDERLIAPDFGRLETAVGFRFWTGISGDLLRSPYNSQISWPTKVAHAECANPRHEPPAPGCQCGWYADIEVADLVTRARGYPRVARDVARVGIVDPPWSYLIVGKVLLSDVLPFRPPPTMVISPRAEYRARVGEIVELGLLDTDGGPEAMAFGQELSDRYDVEVLDISDRGLLDDFAADIEAPEFEAPDIESVTTPPA
jgi:protein-tyrosine-phosphatase